MHWLNVNQPGPTMRALHMILFLSLVGCAHGTQNLSSKVSEDNEGKCEKFHAAKPNGGDVFEFKGFITRGEKRVHLKECPTALVVYDPDIIDSFTKRNMDDFFWESYESGLEGLEGIFSVTKIESKSEDVHRVSILIAREMKVSYLYGFTKEVRF